MPSENAPNCTLSFIRVMFSVENCGLGTLPQARSVQLRHHKGAIWIWSWWGANGDPIGWIERGANRIWIWIDLHQFGWICIEFYRCIYNLHIYLYCSRRSKWAPRGPWLIWTHTVSGRYHRHGACSSSRRALLYRELMGSQWGSNRININLHGSIRGN